jgi:CheY-like chemotaxis protein
MPFHILVVDDNEINLFLLAKILELEGYRVTTALNGLDAIHSFVDNTPDLALLDVMMPEMTGYELCQKMRQPPYNMEIPIVMLTAMSSEFERSRALEVGANDIWSKPFEIQIFRQRIGELLG